jgi:hypothetical protein
MATTLKLPYGLQNGRLLHITEVANGLACECVCPSCGAKLVARNQGQLKAPHFAHHQAPDCPFGVQTALHLAAKDIFLQHQTFCLPGASGTFEFTDDYWASFVFDASFYQACIPGDVGVEDRYYFPARYVTIKSVLLEHRTGDIIPDIILETENGPLLVEIAVTHFIDETKREKIKQLGIPAIEIDLSKVVRDIALPQLEELLIHQTVNKSWAFNAKLDAKIADRQTRYFEAARPYFEEEYAEEVRYQQQVEHQAAQEQLRKTYQTAFNELQRKPITVSELPHYGRVEQVLACPCPRYMHEGQTYAKVQTDCFRCTHFRGYGMGRLSVICMYEYTNRHRTAPAERR